MATSATPRVLEERGLGATLRRDTWWVAPVAVAVGLLAFVIYATWAAWVGDYYEWGPYLSPFYSPLFRPQWWPLSPAFLILWAPLGFRVTCYYYRKAYYRAFFLDPAACAVGEPRHDYHGERKLFLFQNLHRFFMYLAVVFIFILGWDAIASFVWPVCSDAVRAVSVPSACGVLPSGELVEGPRTFGVGVGSLVLTINVILLAAFTFGCHALRHAVGGSLDCFSCARFGRQRYRLWSGVTVLNRRHSFWAWISLFWVGLADLYVRLVAMGVISDLRLL